MFTILIVDDNSNNLYTLNTLLGQVPDIRVFEADSGKNALTMALQEKIDLILLDIQMPEMDGFEVAKLLKLKSRTKNIPIVFITAVFKAQKFFEQGYQSGAVDYLTKPIDDNLLLNKINLYHNLYKKQNDLEEEIKRRIESENIFEAIFTNSAVGIAVVNREGILVTANEAMSEISGYGAKELVGKKMSNFIDPDQQGKFSMTVEKFISGELQNISYEEKLERKDGSELVCELDIAPIPDEKKRLKYLIVMLSDITEMKRMVKEKEKKEQMQIQQAKMAEMGEMIAAIAHQWRQPLNGLGLTIQDIADTYEFGELNKEYIDKTVESSMQQLKQMSNTIDDFRNFFRPDKEKAPFQVNQSINDLVNLVSRQYAHYEVELVFEDFCDDDSCWINGYNNEFKQVLLNLLNNAKDSILEALKEDTTSKGTITVKILQKGKKVLISVTDNGQGIPDEVIARVYDPYFSTKGVDGTGIGLHMSRVIIEENMNGHITCCNLEKGAVFTIELDACNSPE